MADEASRRSFGKKVSDFSAGVKSEFAKIIFPNRERVQKETVTVIIVSILTGAMIFALDFIMKYLLGFIL